MITLALATTLLTSPLATQEVDWTRTYKEKDKTSHHFSMKLEKMKLTFDADVDTTVLAVKPGKVQLQIEMSDIMMSAPFGDQTTTAASPFKTGTVANGMPANITIDTRENSSPVYLLVAAAGATADKKVKAGDTFQVKWKNQANNATLDGIGKVMSINPADKTVTAEIKYVVKITAGRSGVFEYNVTSISSTVDGSLVSSVGTFDANSNIFSVQIKKR